MYLSSLQIKNFRCFDNNKHTIDFNHGLTILVGENDSGKSAIMDAIKIVLGTTDFGWIRIEADDFYNEDTSQEISIICNFSDLTPEEQAAFLECLTYEKQQDDNKPCFYLHWKCKYLSSFKPPRSISSISTGKDANGPAPSSEARELLRVTYLRALRDAYSDMQAGRHSRLSQIVQNIPGLNQGKNEFQDGMDNHFVINSVSFIDGKKYNDCKATYRILRDESDRLCREYQLSVIESPREKGKHYSEWIAEREGKLTWRKLIRDDVDVALS